MQYMILFNSLVVVLLLNKINCRVTFVTSCCEIH